MKNVEGKNEQQLEAIKDGEKTQTIKNKRLRLEDQKKDDKLRLNSLRYLINKENKKQVRYFDMLANFEETKIDYNNLYYTSGNRNKKRSNFEQSGTMAELFEKIKFEKIGLEDVKSILMKFGHELNSLENMLARKQT